MPLLKAARYARNSATPPDLSSYTAMLDVTSLLGDWQLRAAIVAANVNILRRIAPYAYLFASGPAATECQDEDDTDVEYVRDLDALQLQRSVYPCYPMAEPDGPTIVTAILLGDVLPVVNLLAEEEFVLLLLPRYRSLREIDRATASQPSNLAAVRSLLTDGGCVVTNVDDVAFRVWTLDHEVGRYFSEGTPPAREPVSVRGAE